MLTYAVLEGRGILRLGGADRFEFLQGLISNDIYKLKQEKAIYTLLLSPQGKFQYDFFVINVGEELWLEGRFERLEELKKRLQLFKLKSAITLDLGGDQTILAFWGNTNLNVEYLQVGPENEPYSPYPIIFKDPRLPDLGFRVIVPTAQPASLPKDWTLVQETDYRHLCLKLGVPGEADMPIDKAIPLECGMDELHAIDWNKGCYMGQELTARTRYRGLIRKRLIPCSYEGDLTDTVVQKNNKEVGEIRSHNSHIAMVLLRLETLQEEGILQCGMATLKPCVPHWMRFAETES